MNDFYLSVNELDVSLFYVSNCMYLFSMYPPVYIIPKFYVWIHIYICINIYIYIYVYIYICIQI